MLLPFSILFPNKIRPGFGKESSNDSFIDQGMATVEASITIPLFLIFCVFMIQLVMALTVEERIYNSFSEAVSTSSIEAYMAGSLGETGESLGIFGIVSVRLQKELSKIGGLKTFVPGGSLGVVLSKARLNENGEIEAEIFYRIRPTMALFRLPAKRITERLVQKAYTGYVRTGEEADDEYVYITDTGSVYHKSRACYHLNLKVHKVSSTGLPACNVCKRAGGDSKYVGESGECYHKSPSCPSIKRTIMRVKKSEAKGYGPCSNCGG